MARKLHSNEMEIGAELVRKLVDSQFPQYISLPVKPMGAFGSSNVQYLLGDELLVRLPRLPGGGAAIAKECQWLPAVGSYLPLAVPEIVGVGAPAFGYSERWSLVRWQSGTHPATCSPEDPSKPERLRLASELACLLAAFRDIEISAEARSDRLLTHAYRGRALVEYDSQMRKNVEDCRRIAGLKLDLDAAIAMWKRSMKLPGASAIPREDHHWFHGDIVAENLLQKDGKLCGLLDFGGLGLGDPTIDLHGAWELLDAPARNALRKRLGVNDSTWLRGRAWALAVSLMTLPYYWNTMPDRVENRLKMARSVLADPE